MKPRERVIRVLLRLLAHPYRHTRRDLWEYFDVSKDAIDKDILAIKAAAINFDQEKKGLYRCAILPDPKFDELHYLQSLTDEDRGQISSALSKYYASKKVTYLNNKLSSLYDFQQLGLNALRRPALEKLNNLEAARKSKKQVILENYRSNSNEIKDRLVEVFRVDPELDMFQAFDPEEKRKHRRNKHFKLSRINRVIITDHSWQHESKHVIKPTDVFRIAMANQVMVQLKIDVYAYNSLIDNYPKAKGECDPGSKPNTFYFQSKVNPEFLGLINFIMNNAGHVEIISPLELKNEVRKRINTLLKDLEK